MKRRTKKWFRSKTVVCVCAALFCAIAPKFGLEVLPEAHAQEIYAALTGLIVIFLRDASGDLQWKPSKKVEEGNGAG